MTPSNEIIISQAAGMQRRMEPQIAKSLEQPTTFYAKANYISISNSERKERPWIHTVFSKGSRVHGHLTTRVESTKQTSSCHDLVLTPQPNHLDG